MQKNNTQDEKVVLELTKEEYESFKNLQKNDEEKRKKPNNIYQNLKINPRILDFVIMAGVLVIILVIILGM